MSTQQTGIIGKVFGLIAKPFDWIRKTLHFLLLIILFAFVFAGLAGSTPKLLTESSALLFAPNGSLVEQLSGDAFERALADAQGQAVNETLVRDVIAALEGASNDSNVKLMVMDLDSLTGASLSKLQDVAQAVEIFKESGKKIYAYSEFMSQNQYYLASLADEVYLHPQGAVLIEGYGRYRMYMQEAIEKLSIDWNVFKVGEYKSFVEPYLRNDMSEQDKSSAKQWMDALWQEYTADVEAARELNSGAITDYANTFADTLESNGGSMADAALAAGLVDGLLDRVGFRKKIIELVGKKKKSDTFKQFSLNSYIASQKAIPVKYTAGKDKVAVVVAAGSIMDGSQPSGSIGGDSTSKLIRKAMNDKDVKALVLKVDSGGGSAFASDVILTAINEFKATGRPVITSMNSVAASGGYMIALAADEIWATSSTLTGSIGIFGMIPTFDRSIKRLGLNVDGFGTTKLSGAFSFGRPLDDDIQRIMQANIENGYDDFIGKVAEGRDMSKEAVDQVARGRVWIAQDALEHGLIDKIGSFEDSVQQAANLAKLSDYEVKYIEKELSMKEQFAINFFTKVSASGLSLPKSQWEQGTSGQVIKAFEEKIIEINSYNDPRGMYMDCLCEIN